VDDGFGSIATIRRREAAAGHLRPYGVAAKISCERPFARARRGGGGGVCAAAAPGRARRSIRSSGVGSSGPLRPDRAWCPHSANVRDRARAAVPERTVAGRNPTRGPPSVISQQAQAPGAVNGVVARRGIDGEVAAVFPLRHRLRGIARQQAASHEAAPWVPAQLRRHLGDGVGIDPGGGTKDAPACGGGVEHAVGDDTVEVRFAKQATPREPADPSLAGADRGAQPDASVDRDLVDPCQIGRMRNAVNSRFRHSGVRRVGTIL
jgi:hypothetical protein